MPEGQILEFSGLTKRFGAVTAVENFTARVEPGVVTGFLGPNGAGKTTTLRILLGLVRATEGQATIGGVPYAQLREPLRAVGATLEASSFHPGRTAFNHLKISAQAAKLPLDRVEESLATVGLSEVADRKVGGFSLGMRQRLGLAYALLGDPGVLVLDEPVNGLDPEGIKWMRGLLRTLAAQGRTVLVSSHLLTEVQQTADDLVIISQGRLVYQGSLGELAYADDALVVADSPDRAALAAAFTAASLDFDLLRSGLNVRGHEPAELGRIALDAGVPLSNLQRKSGGIEEIFLELVSGLRTHPSAVAPTLESAAPESGTAESAAPESGTAESAVAEAAAVDAVAADVVAVDAVVADAVVADAVVAEAAQPDAAEGVVDLDEAEAEIEAEAEAEGLDEQLADEDEDATAASLAAEFAAESGVTPGAAASAGAAEAGAMAWAVHSDGETEAVETGAISVITEVPGAGPDDGETAWAVGSDGETESVRTASIPVINVGDSAEVEAEAEAEAPVEVEAERGATSFDDLLSGRGVDAEESSAEVDASQVVPAHAADDTDSSNADEAPDVNEPAVEDEAESSAEATETAPDDQAEPSAEAEQPDEAESQEPESEPETGREHPHDPQKTDADLEADRFFAAFTDDGSDEDAAAEDEAPAAEASDSDSFNGDTPDADADPEPDAHADIAEHPRTDEEGGEWR